MRFRSLLAAASALVAIASPSPAAAADPLYRLDDVTRLSSTDTDWDYIRLEPHGSRLFIARRKDGLTVFDVNARKVVAQVANSVGANGPLLLPEFNRGYVAMTDGSLLSFNLATLAVIDRVKLDEDGGINGVVYDPATKHVQAVVGPRPAQSTWYTIDARTGRLLGKKAFPFKKMDDPAPDGKGNLFAPARYDNLLLRLDSATLEEKGRIAIDCVQVVAVEYEADSNRIFIGCRGDKPVFIALDAATGRQLASIPIGKGIDGMAIDHERHRILTSNGGDSSLTVIQQDGPDSYHLLGNVQTRPQARVMQIDEETGRLFTVTADATFPAPDADGTARPPIFHPDSFVILTYKPTDAIPAAR
jgi:DNA-binding beta-propeller fold protein YncE